MKVPNRPKIFHITHLENLSSIVSNGWIWSDAKRIEHRWECRLVGMSAIKRRRLEELEVACHPGTRVGQYVPFYFCPRSIMLYILHRGNHESIDYREGQRPIIHLQSDLMKTVEWADANGIPWAFSSNNAGARYASFHASLDDLMEINWTAVQAADFRDPLVKEGKQAEFLVLDSFPWSLVEKIGVIDVATARQARRSLDDAGDRPVVTSEPGWYY